MFFYIYYINVRKVILPMTNEIRVHNVRPKYPIIIIINYILCYVYIVYIIYYSIMRMYTYIFIMSDIVCIYIIMMILMLSLGI